MPQFFFQLGVITFWRYVIISCIFGLFRPFYIVFFNMFCLMTRGKVPQNRPQGERGNSTFRCKKMYRECHNTARSYGKHGTLLW